MNSKNLLSAYCSIFRLFEHASDPDIDEPVKIDPGHILGAELSIPGEIIIIFV